MEYKFYNEFNGGQYLELHANRTMWEINKNFDEEDYNYLIECQICKMEQHYKYLTVYLKGRSCRHVCVDDTPINRRRYKYLVNYAEELEQEVIDYFNNK